MLSRDAVPSIGKVGISACGRCTSIVLIVTLWQFCCLVSITRAVFSSVLHLCVIREFLEIGDPEFGDTDTVG